MMQPISTQLPLRLNPQEVYQFDNFHFNHPELQQVISEFCHLSTIDFLYIWGEPAAGKSHLLMATLEQIQRTNKRGLYLPLAQLISSTTPLVLESLEHLDLLCLDELEVIEGRPEWEEAIFHCFNRLQHSGCKLLIASTHNPATSAIALADLRSRLATGLVYQLNTLNDNDKQQVLILQAQARGLQLSDDVVMYLLRHYSRDVRVLMDLLQRLDKASMAAKRRLTIPFVRHVLNNG